MKINKLYLPIILACGLIYKYFKRCYYLASFWNNKRLFPASNIHETVSLGEVTLQGNIIIGAGSYINSGQLTTNVNSKIVIGSHCEIGYNVRIVTEAHDIKESTGPNRIVIEKDIIIGDNVWIGSNVFIKEGITIGNQVIIGANSIVTRDIPDFAIVGGVPAKVIKYKNQQISI